MKGAGRITLAPADPMEVVLAGVVVPASVKVGRTVIVPKPVFPYLAVRPCTAIGVSAIDVGVTTTVASI